MSLFKIYFLQCDICRTQFRGGTWAAQGSSRASTETRKEARVHGWSRVKAAAGLGYIDLCGPCTRSRRKSRKETRRRLARDEYNRSVGA